MEQKLEEEVRRKVPEFARIKDQCGNLEKMLVECIQTKGENPECYRIQDELVRCTHNAACPKPSRALETCVSSLKNVDNPDIIFEKCRNEVMDLDNCFTNVGEKMRKTVNDFMAKNK